MIFVFDLDDTVCDTDSYSEEYISKFIIENNLPYKKLLKIQGLLKKIDWDLDTALNWYKKYGDEMMGKFPCKENALKVINQLYDSGNRIVIATARATDWHSDPENVTKRWLEEVGLKYHKLYIGRVDKEVICNEENADVFIDDDVDITKRVASYFCECGKSTSKTFLMTTGYNKKLRVANGVIRINSFKEFANNLKEFNI